jgi:eukaryotic-like serine/threonine-protein kinase
MRFSLRWARAEWAKSIALRTHASTAPLAIKVLPSHLSSDPELKQRMEREAKAISALQHANICTLRDLGTQDGTNFLVMEYLEGQTLGERLGKGALPLDQVLKIGTEIAQALESAHQQGIIAP